MEIHQMSVLQGKFSDSKIMSFESHRKIWVREKLSQETSGEHLKPKIYLSWGPPLTISNFHDVQILIIFNLKNVYAAR